MLYRAGSFQNFKDMLYRVSLYGEIEIKTNLKGEEQTLSITMQEDDSYRFVIIKADERVELTEDAAFKLYYRIRYKEKSTGKRIYRRPKLGGS